MKIKAVILAAGEGTRLVPFSAKEYPKVLFRFLGKPLILYHLEEFLEQGVRDFVIVCNPLNKKVVQGVAKEAYPNLRVSFAVQKRQLGPAHAIWSAKKYLQNTGFFILRYADSFTKISQLKVVLERFLKDPQDGFVLLSKVKDFSRFGIARFRERKLVEIVEKPKTRPPSDLAWRGICILSVPKFLKGFREEKVKPGKKEVTPPEYVLRAGGELNYRILSYQRLDLGYPWDILLFNRVILEKFGGKVLSKNIGRGVVISPKSYIGLKTVLEDGVKIGDYVSLEDAYVAQNTIISDSYIMEGVRIGPNSNIEKSVLGQDTAIGARFITKIRSREPIKVLVRGEYRKSPFGSLGCFLGHKVRVENNLFAESGRIVYSSKEVNKNIVHDILPICAIFFDADNTLYPSRRAARKADLKVMKYLATQTSYQPKRLYQYWREKIVKKLRESKIPRERRRQYSYQKLIRQFKLKKSAKKAFLIFRTELIQSLKVSPYLKPILAKLPGYKKVVVSEDNRDLLAFKLKKLDLGKYFDLVIAAETIGVMKPSPLYFQYGLEKLKLFPQEVVMIGDEWEKDLKVAFDLGLRTIIWGKEDRRAHRSIKDFRELPRILEQL